MAKVMWLWVLATCMLLPLAEAEASPPWVADDDTLLWALQWTGAMVVRQGDHKVRAGELVIVAGTAADAIAVARVRPGAEVVFRKLHEGRVLFPVYDLPVRPNGWDRFTDRALGAAIIGDDPVAEESFAAKGKLAKALAASDKDFAKQSEGNLFGAPARVLLLHQVEDAAMMVSYAEAVAVCVSPGTDCPEEARASSDQTGAGRFCVSDDQCRSDETCGVHQCRDDSFIQTALELTATAACQRDVACQVEGRCTASDGSCIAGSDEQCAESYGCGQHGLCAVENGTCVADSDANCAASGDCTTVGTCRYADGKCVATNETCSASETCPRSGHCSAVEGVCQPASDADCALSTGCRQHGRCELDGGSCKPMTDQSCADSEMCAYEGKCTTRNGSCRFDQDLDCRRLPVCRDEGKCRPRMRRDVIVGCME